MLDISKHYVGEKWRSFTNSMRIMLKLVHEVVWQVNNLAYSSRLMFVWPGHFYNCFLGHYSVRFGYEREQNYTEIGLKHAF